MLKDFLLVSCGSFLGGGLRFLVSKWIQTLSVISFPFGTFTVNVLGCFLIGFLSGLPVSGEVMNPNTKLFLTTGFCGGFTTFSTFMNENSSLLKDENYVYLILYIFGSLALGMAAVLLGNFFGNKL